MSSSTQQNLKDETGNKGQSLTIVMYHYVRERVDEYPDFRCITPAQFEQQLNYIEKHYTVISADTLIDADQSSTQLPLRPLLLTFDDGLIDHFSVVLPMLLSRNLAACFFPPVKAIERNVVLDVHKLHFVLAKIKDKQSLVEQIISTIDLHRAELELPEGLDYLRRFLKKTRFDLAQVAFIKTMLQKELPKTLRSAIVASMFEKHVTQDENSFAKELYMSMNEVIEIKQNGMYIGGHGDSHSWLNELDKEQQEKEIDQTLFMLKQVGTDTTSWVFAYPYGAFNESLLEILRVRGCRVGLTTEVNLADLSNDNSMLLPRLDTNDLPKESSALVNQWTRLVSS